MRISTLICLVLAFAFPAMAQKAADYQTPTKEVQKFVRDVVLGGRRDATAKWTALPQLRVSCSDPAMKTLVETTSAGLSQAAGLTAPGEGVLQVFIGSSPRDFGGLEIAQKYKLALGGGTWSQAWNNDDGSLKDVVICISDDSSKTTPDYMKSRIENDLRAAYGMAGVSEQFEESVFYQSKKNSAGRVIPADLTPLDKMLVSFFYKHVPSGSRSGDIPKLLRQYWNK